MASKVDTAKRHEENANASGGGKWFVLVAIGVGSFMSALDGSIVNTVLPVISHSLGADIAAVEWVVTVYLLVVSGLLLSFGRLGDMRGHKSVYVFGFAIFVAASAFCGLAPSVKWLTVSRAVQAIGAAVLFANSPAILTANFPPSQRGQALGLQATMTYLGLTVGPSLGGFLATEISWRAVFYVNVPVGLLALALSLRFIPRDVPVEAGQRFDLAGAATFMAGLVALMLALNQGSEWGWGSTPVLALLAAAVVLLGSFVAIERRAAAPMLDLNLFGNRLFSASTASAIANYICLYSILFLLPFYLIQGRGLSAEQAGVLLTAQPVLMAIAAPISGTLSDRMGSRLLSTAGMVILAAGMVLLSRLGPDAPLIQIPLVLALVGLGVGTFIAPNTSALMGSAPKNRQGIAAGTLATARNAGMVLGVGLAGAVLTSFTGQSAAQPTGNAPLFAGISAGLLLGGVVACAGIITSAVRGGHTQFQK